MMSFAEDNQITITEVDWKELDQELRDRLEHNSKYVRYKAWEETIFEFGLADLFSVLPSTSYPINEMWADQLHHMRED